MFHQHHGNLAFLLNVHDKSDNILFFLLIHPGHGLVQEQDIRGQGQGTSHLDFFLDTIAEISDQAFAVGLQLHKIDDVLDIGPVLGLYPGGFPAPLGPMMEVIRPGSIVILTSDNALSPPKESVTSEIVSCAIYYPNSLNGIKENLLPGKTKRIDNTD